MLNELVVNHHLIEALWSAVNTSSGSLVNVAPLVKKVLKTGAWKKRVVPQLGKEPITFERFADFIQNPPLQGCGWPLDKVEALIKDDADTLAMWHKAITAPAHRPVSSNNITTYTTKRGTSKAYTLSRLKDGRPDLFKKVSAKTMSANAAAIEAGIRKKPVKRCPKCGHEW